MCSCARSAFEEPFGDKDANGLTIRRARNAQRKGLFDLSFEAVARLIVSCQDGRADCARNRLMDTFGLAQPRILKRRA
jgi:hypothetical protein